MPKGGFAIFMVLLTVSSFSFTSDKNTDEFVSDPIEAFDALFHDTTFTRYHIYTSKFVQPASDGKGQVWEGKELDASMLKSVNLSLEQGQKYALDKFWLGSKKQYRCY